MVTLSKTIMLEVEQAVRANPDANVTLLDSDGIYRYIGPAATVIMGFTQQDIQDKLGRHYTEYMHKRDLAHLALAFQDVLLTGGTVPAPRYVKIKSGGYRRMSGAGRRLIDEASGELYVLIIGRPCD